MFHKVHMNVYICIYNVFFNLLEKNAKLCCDEMLEYTLIHARITCVHMKARARTHTHAQSQYSCNNITECVDTF